MPRLFTYTIPIDDGAAPNPFRGMCSLAICKPGIRRVAKKGDWVAGLRSKDAPSGDLSGHLVYAMHVEAVLSLKEYDEQAATEWPYRIPDVDSLDLSERLGDCIYDYSQGAPKQRRSVRGEFCTTIQDKYSNYPIRQSSCESLALTFQTTFNSSGGLMPHTVEVKKGQTFQDGTGLTVRVGAIDASERVHFAVIKDQNPYALETAKMSYFAFIHRFTRINSVEEACARTEHLGYVASRRVRIYSEEFELMSDPYPQADQIAIRAKAKSDSRVRILRLPVTIVQGGRGQVAEGSNRSKPREHLTPP